MALSGDKTWTLTETQIVNAASVTSTEIATPTVATVTDTVILPQLSVAKTSNAAGVVVPGSTLTYTVVVSNVGNSPATGVKQLHLLPAARHHRPDVQREDLG